MIMGPTAPFGPMIILDQRPGATTYLSNSLWHLNRITRHYHDMQEEWQCHVRVGPQDNDILIVPISGVQFGHGATSRIALQDALCTDGFGLKLGNADPGTWTLWLRFRIAYVPPCSLAN